MPGVHMPPPSLATRLYFMYNTEQSREQIFMCQLSSEVHCVIHLSFVARKKIVQNLVPFCSFFNFLIYKGGCANRGDKRILELAL